MDKKYLQNTILEAAYNREVWLEVLKEFFGVRKIHIKPQHIIVDKSKAEYAVELGSFITTDEKLVGIFEVKLLPQVWIERNRVGLRSLLRQVYKYDVDGALIVFVKDDKWRFSYVSEIRTEEGKKETEPKRYTYLLGQNESCRTAADRFDKLKGKPIYLNDLFEAFSVEKLNKDFFKTYKEYYEKFWKYLAGEKKYYNLLVDKRQTEEEKKQKPIRDFVKKLLGRIVFLQFLQKKGWMGVPSDEIKWEGGDVKFLQSLFKNHIDKNKFHSTALKTLFFETLNTKRANDLAPASLGSGIKVPYLNGGLFDKDIYYQNDFDFPVDLFKNLFDFFEQYNFTIDENDPYDNQVGIDPEMLGHIFENLLEENREKGAFYTPKEIVHYMCQESLIEYLHTQFPTEAKEDFNLLVRSNQVAQSITTHKNATDINNKLKAVKICDPAIGSGAFTIGLLKEVFECRRLIYPYLKTNESFSLAEVKKEIIQQNIYGVDIENGAVEIARLRFWLALVVDEIEPHPLPNLDYKIMQGNSLLESFEGVDLSNLADMEKEQTFISASKAQFELGSELSLDKTTMLVFDEKSKQQLYDLINDYYSYDETINTKYPNKQFIKDQINSIVEGKLIAKFFLEKPKIEKSIKHIKKAIASNISKKDDTPALKKKKEKNIEKLNRDLRNKQLEIEKLNIIIKQLHELQIRTDKPYFLWHLWFKDVFDKGGFDIIIGNPPYIQLQKIGADADTLQEVDFETFIRTGDIYCLFYEKGFNLLRKGGTLSYITSNKWMRGGYGKSLRKYFTKINTKKILNLGPGIFHSATVDTNIYLGKKELFTNQTKGILIENRSDILTLQDSDLIPLKDLNEDAWVVLDANELRILKLFELYGKPLRDWNIEIYRGILTGFNEAFIIDEIKYNQLIAEDPRSEEIIKPILKGREIQRYHVEWKNDFIISTFPSLNIDINKYKAVKKYLESFQPKLNQEGKTFINKKGKKEKTRKKTGNKWFETQDQIGFVEEFKKEKVIWKRIGSIMRFAYSDEEIYCLDSTCIATGEKIKYLTAVLNSKAGLYQLFKTSPQTGTGDQIISVQALEPLFVHYPTDEVERKFNLIVDIILFIKKSSVPILKNYSNEILSRDFEDIVDQMVYELYFKEHMHEKEIDVLKFINFTDITQIKTFEEKRDTVQKIYYWLKEKDNSIRNRILVSNSRSDIISRINESIDYL